MTRAAYGHTAIWAIALPMILSSITVPLVGLVDTAVVGHLPDRVYLAAVAAGAQIFSVLFLSLNFLRMSTTGVTAQAAGARDGRAIRQCLAQAVIVAVVLGVLIVGLQAPIRTAAVRVIGADPGVSQYVAQYFDVRIWSAPAALYNFVAVGWLLGMQNARGPLAITLIINLVNVALDVWLVFSLGLHVRGVAAASLIAEYTGAIVATVLLAQELTRHPGSWPRSAIRSLRSYRRILGINGDLFIRTLALMFTFTFITAQGARMGSVFLAVNAVLMNFQWLMSYALDGIANAAEALVGKAVGARDRAGLLLVARRTMAWSLAFALAFTACYAAAGGRLIDWQTSLPDVRSTAREYLPWLLISPLVSVWSFFYDGVYVGAVRSREMRVVMMASVLLVFLPVWFVFRDLGNHAIWLAFTLFMAARGIGMHLWFRHMVAGDLLFRSPDIPASSTRY